MATYDHELVLISETIQEDEIGNRIPIETRKTILCDKKSAGRNEYYQAAAAGLKPELVLIVHAYEYNGEQLVEFEGKRYSVIRIYELNDEEIELVCERKAGNG